MVLTLRFREIVAARIASDPCFRASLLEEALALFLASDVQTGNAVLRDFINATIGFEALARETGTTAKSLMLMLGPKGNPTASNLFAVLKFVQQAEGIELSVSAERSM